MEQKENNMEDIFKSLGIITSPLKIENEFEKELFKLIDQYCKMGLKKPDLVHKMKYVTRSCEMS